MKKTIIRETWEADTSTTDISSKLVSVDIMRNALKLCISEHEIAIEEINDMMYKKDLSVDFIMGYKACYNAVIVYHKLKIKELEEEIKDCNLIIEENS